MNTTPIPLRLPDEHLDVRAKAMRSIATFEAIKGIAAIAAGIGFVSLLHRDLHQMVATLIGHVGLDPGHHYPALLLHGVDSLQNAHVRTIVLTCIGYAALRLTESYALWNQTMWGQWLGALSGLLYVPFELAHFLHGPTVLGAIVIAANLIIVGFLGNQIWQGRGKAHA